MNELLADVDRLTGTDQLCRPTPVRDRWGRYKRDPGGQWDWFYALEPVERKYIAGRHMNGVIGPDHVADILHTDIDSAMQTWLAAVRRERSGDPLDDSYLSCDDDDIEQLIGPDELATLLNVQRNTVVQWRKRGILLAPFMELSGMPIWRRDDVAEWAALTGRTLA